MPVYDLSVDGADPVDIDFHGLEVRFEGDTNVWAAAAASAGSGESDLIWLANLGAVGHATDKPGDSGAPDAIVGAGAFAKDGGDAEIGVSNLYVDLTGAGQVIAAGGMIAAASGEGSKAAALGGDVRVSAEGGSSAHAAAAVVASTDKGHAGQGDDEDEDEEEDEHKRDKHDEDEDEDEDEEHEEDEHDHGNDNTQGSRAEVALDDITVQATALNGDARAELSVEAHTGDENRHASSTALVSIEGDVSVAAFGRSGEAIVNVTASGEGEVHIAGKLNLSVQGNSEGRLDIFAQNSGSSVVVGDIDVTVGEDAQADLNVQFSHSDGKSSKGDDEHSSGEVFIGDVTGHVDGSLDLHIGELGGDATSDAGRSAAFTGEGDVEMELHDQVFGSIDVSELEGRFELEMDLDETHPETPPHTTIAGYDAHTDSVKINGDELSDENVAVLGLIRDGEIKAFTDEAELFAQLEGALHGHDDYAFAVYTGEDITGDGVDEWGLGVLVYDDHGKGITTVLYLENVDTVQELVGTHPS